MTVAMEPRLHRLIYTARTLSWLVDPRRFLRVPDYPIDRPIFLLGVQGGGLTLLSRMLRRHPDVISVAGNSAYWTAADEMQNVYGLVLPASLSGTRYKAPPHPVLTAPRSWTYAARDLYPLYRKDAADATGELRRALTWAIRFSALRHARDPRHYRFVDKSQTFTVRVGLIHALLAGHDPHFVLVPREPYVSVVRAADGRAGDMRRLRAALPLDERIDICAEHYGNSMRAALDDCDRYGVRLHILRFEDLLAAPEASLRAVCEFAGLDFRPDMLPAPSHTLPIGSRFLDRWYPLKPEINDRYAASLDAWTIDRVNHHCKDLLGRLGSVERV